MKLIQHVESEKLRGGYYTGDAVVDWCIGRVLRLAGPTKPSCWLEPSAGDGAFIRGLRRFCEKGVLTDVRVEAIEVLEQEAAKCRQALRTCGFAGKAINESFFTWADGRMAEFDALVGNPPYVRYQYVDPVDRHLAEQLTNKLGVELRGVSNLWIPFALVSMSLLKPGGAFALVLPGELFCTGSGGQFRAIAVRDFASLRIDLFPRNTFPNILQDVAIVSGIRAMRTADRRPVTFCEHRGGAQVEWKHTVEATPESWQRYLLTETEVSAFREAAELDGIHRLGEIARIEVSTVTGANPFFTVDDVTLREYDLKAWARPLLARTSDSPGILFTTADHTRARKSGSRAWLLDFSEDRPQPNRRGRVSEYLAKGEELGLPERFKCRIRSPWYRIPHIKSGRLMMSKRAHFYHRLILNQAGVFTTDTIYRGQMLELFAHLTEYLIAGFQNTLTLLSSEVEGRTYGGGVLELVPSEISRLLTPLVPMPDLLRRLDVISRTTGGQRDDMATVLNATDSHLCKLIPGYGDLLPTLRTARIRLRNRRMDVASAANADA